MARNDARLPLVGQEARTGLSWHIRLLPRQIRNVPTVQRGHNLSTRLRTKDLFVQRRKGSIREFSLVLSVSYMHQGGGVAAQQGLALPSLLGPLWLGFVIREVVRVGLVVSVRVTGAVTGTGLLNSRAGPSVTGSRLATTGVRLFGIRVVGAVPGAMAWLATAVAEVIVSTAAVFFG